MPLFVPHLKQAGHLEELTLTICNVGSRKVNSKDDYGTQWQLFAPNLAIYGFDADADACEAANADIQARDVPWMERHIPLALSDKEGEAVLYVTKDPMCSSLYPPNESYLKRFAGLSALMNLDFTVEIETTTLDQACETEGVAAIDFLQIDVQGADLKVLQGGIGMLSHSILAVQIEVEFCPLYVGQPLFAEVDQFLRSQGFTFFGLTGASRPRHHSPVQSVLRPGQLLWGDALYLRDLIAPDCPPCFQSPQHLLKLACIADLLDLTDYALELLEYLTLHYGQQPRYNLASSIVRSLSQVPAVVEQGLDSLPIVANLRSFLPQTVTPLSATTVSKPEQDPTTDPAKLYWQYLEQHEISLNPEAQAKIADLLEQSSWQAPKSLEDYNNLAVLALIRAEACQDRDTQGSHLETAIATLEHGRSYYPLCDAHLALVHQLIGEREQSLNMALAVVVNVLQPLYTEPTEAPCGLVYLPSQWLYSPNQNGRDCLTALLAASNGLQQGLWLAAEVLWRSPIFYNFFGQRYLTLASHLSPGSAAIHHRLGVARLLHEDLTGLFHLHQAQQRSPYHAGLIQSLYLAYRNAGNQEASSYWRTLATQQHQQYPEQTQWQWVSLPETTELICVTYETDLLLAVEPSFSSIVTSVLLAEGDWFEADLEWWRSLIQPGMTVIDVGANAGVYTFSAARRVGSAGKVLAVEPLSKCVRLLEETCRLNHLEQVSICHGAASDRTGTIQISISVSSELSQVVTDAAATSRSDLETVACYTLDSLVEHHHFTQVDVLKIDAEQHELQVLTGSDRLLTEFAPIILYENNQPEVAKFLDQRHYFLFYYRPYIQELVPITDVQDLEGKLNLIAIPQSKL